MQKSYKETEVRNMPETLENTQGSPFESDHTLRLILRFAIPSVIAFLVQALYNIVDQIFIGQIVGYLGNAATNVTFPLVTFSVAGGVLIGDGTAAMMSLRMGAGHSREAGTILGTGLITSILVGAGFLLAGSFFLQPMLLSFGATEAVLPFALDYASIIVIGLPFSMVSITLNNSIRVDGHPRFAMVTMLVGTVLNIVLDAWFMIGFKWGVRGAAIATIIGQMATLALCVLYMPRYEQFRIEKSDLRIRASYLKRVAALGISSFITQIAIAIVQIVINNQIIHFGAQSVYGTDIPLSAFGIVMKVNMILISTILGFAVGSQPIWGYNYGAQRYASVRKIYATTVTIALCISVSGFIFFQTDPDVIIGLFGQEEALYNEFAERCFRIFLFGVFCAGFQITSAIFFQAIGKPVRSILLSLSRQTLFLIPLLLLLPEYYGIDGILYAGPIADIAAATFALVLIIFEMIQLRRQELRVRTA